MMHTVVDHQGELARELLAARDEHRQVPPVSDRNPGFSLREAYWTAGQIMQARNDRGERTVGWKIGFTNRTIWNEYDVHAPIWGPMYDSTVSALPPGVTGEIAAADYLEPRIEPEIVFQIGRVPEAGMSADDLLDCIDAVAHGFEIVQSVFPKWRFKAADTAAAFGLHGCLRHGPWLRLDRSDEEEWAKHLSHFEITLWRKGIEVDHGYAKNVLDGPLHALRHMVDKFDPDPFGRGIEAGDIVTTGTVTRAFPVAEGQIWSTLVRGLPLKGVALQIT